MAGAVHFPDAFLENLKMPRDLRTILIGHSPETLARLEGLDGFGIVEALAAIGLIPNPLQSP